MASPLDSCPALVLNADFRPLSYFPLSLRTKSMGSVFRELWLYMRVRKKFWLAPIMVVMGLLGGLIVLTKGSAVAPFIYALF